MQLSIVTTLYKSAPYIREFYERAIAAAEEVAGEFEIIFVNDGSPDEAVDIAIELHEHDRRVVVVDLSRNFGHHRAMMTGLKHARGELVFLIDVDLQERPEYLPEFVKALREKNCDVVYGVQQKRAGGLFERLSGEVYYWAVKQLDVPVPRNLTTMRLMTRRYVRSLVRHRERQLVMSGLWRDTGYKQEPYLVAKNPSTHKSNYSFGHKVILAINGVTSFSTRPLELMFYAGLSLSLTAVLYICVLIVRYFTIGPQPGWTSIIASIWLFGGLQIFFLGLIGLYLVHIFHETKRRPYSIVRHLYRTDEEEKRAPQAGAAAVDAAPDVEFGRGRAS
jgi:putative glycosyltransferase